MWAKGAAVGNASRCPRSCPVRRRRSAGNVASQIVRKRIEEHFGWGKTIGCIRQTVHRGLKRVDQHFKLTMWRATSCGWHEC